MSSQFFSSGDDSVNAITFDQTPFLPLLFKKTIRRRI